MIAQLDKEYIKIRPQKVIPRLISYAFFEGRPLTTSGRWINSVVFNLFKLQKKLPQLRKVNAPIFILGTGRSGTTLLGMLLSMHKSVGFLNEPKAIWHSIYPYEDIIGSYTEKIGNYRLNNSAVTPKIIEEMHKIFGFYLMATASSRVVDKYPELIFRTEFVKTIFPDAKFLFLVRNGWDTCASIVYWSEEHGNSVEDNTEDWWGKDDRKWDALLKDVVAGNPEFDYNEVKQLTDHKDKAALEWIVTMQEGLKLMENKALNIHLVKFEDITRDTQNSLISILEFCKLPVDDKFLRYARLTVKPVPAKKEFQLHPSISMQFRNMMKRLGYIH